jgi:hypothetical protein
MQPWEDWDWEVAERHVFARIVGIPTALQPQRLSINTQTCHTSYPNTTQHNDPSIRNDTAMETNLQHWSYAARVMAKLARYAKQAWGRLRLDREKRYTNKGIMVSASIAEAATGSPHRRPTSSNADNMAATRYDSIREGTVCRSIACNSCRGLANKHSSSFAATSVSDNESGATGSAWPLCVKSLSSDGSNFKKRASIPISAGAIRSATGSRDFHLRTHTYKTQGTAKLPKRTPQVLQHSVPSISFL